METRYRIKIGFLLLVFLCLSACSSVQKAADSGAATGSSQSTSPPEIYGPPLPQASPAYGPEPIQLKPIVLVLGPGMARGFAYAGVFRALHDAKIPVGAVLGTEMGAFVGVLYAFDGNINHFEWSLMKFKNEIFMGDGNIFKKLLSRPSDGRALAAKLKEAYLEKDLSESRLPVRVALQPKGSPRPAIYGGGKAAELIQGAMATAPIFAPLAIESEEMSSAAETRPFMVTEGRALGLGPVVVIDVITQGPDLKTSDIGAKLGVAAKAAETELKDADLLIQLRMPGIGYLDYSKRTQAAFHGKKAIQERLPELRHLVGLPRVEPGNGAETQNQGSAQ